MFRGELFVSRYLRNPVVRGCPQCIRVEAQETSSPLHNITLRGEWQLRGAGVCLKHSHPLVPLWSRQNPVERFDVGGRIAEVLPDILTGKLNSPVAPPSSFDLWLHQRLSTGEDRTWLAGQPLFPAMTFCSLLGAELIRKSVSDAPKDCSEDRAASALGFETAARGPAAIQDKLHKLAAAADGALDEPQKAFGKLYVSLNRAYKEDDGFDGFREILRGCILDVWPIAPGKMVLGRRTAQRRLHSVHTASKEIGIGGALLDSFLTEAGAFSDGDKRPRSRKVFDAQRFADLFEEIPNLIGPNTMREAIGATLHELKALEKDGVLVPFTKLPRIRSRWRAADGDVLLTQLSKLADAVDPQDPGWETLQLARNRTGMPLSDLIRSCNNRTIGLGKRSDVFGYHGFVLRHSDVDHLTAQNDKAPAAPLRGGLSLAQFGRSVGLRGKGNISSLVSSGHISATEVVHPKTGKRLKHIFGEDATSFHRKFVTISTIAAETGLHWNSVRTVVNAAGLKPFSPDGQDFGAIYLRNNVKPLLAMLSSKDAAASG